MKLLQQILDEAGADTSKAFTVIPSFGAYFKCVKCVVDYSPQKVVLSLHKITLTVTGENLTIGKFFEGDLLIFGDVRGTQIE
jgi:hypothetical protein